MKYHNRYKGENRNPYDAIIKLLPHHFLEQILEYQNVDLRVLETKSISIHQNLALDHAILQHAARSNLPTLRFWVNEPSVVLGRAQILQDEVDEHYCSLHNIILSRRISSGGCVYHDEGNINWSIYLPSRFSLKTETRDIPGLVHHLTRVFKSSLEQVSNVTFAIENNSNVLANERKISGSAGYLHKKWYLHHATLLLDANLGHLDNCLLAREKDPDDRRRSRYFETMNLLELDQAFDKTIWKKALIQALGLSFDFQVKYEEITENEINLAKKLEYDLYTKNHWVQEGKRKHN